MSIKKFALINGVVISLFFWIPDFLSTFFSIESKFNFFHFFFIFYFFIHFSYEFTELLQLRQFGADVLVNASGFIFFFFYGYFLTLILNKSISNKKIILALVFLSLPLLSIVVHLALLLAGINVFA